MNLNSVYNKSKNVILLLGAITWILFFFIPIPGIVIDFAIISSIIFSFFVLYKALTIKDWSDIRTFPLILLYSTLFRTSLNITTTRKIISGESPGQVVESFGHWIVDGLVLIGLVMFIIIIVVQFIVANGAGRFGEVAARFALDALPGKQMSIDSELSQGIIDDKTAKRLKRRLELQTDFYGNLDGAGKYIKGDVWASVLMIVINLVVGLIVGMVNLDMSFTEAASKFTLLTIGDGVVNAVSALIITFSGAIVMGKVEEDEEGEEEKTKANVVQRILLDIMPTSTVFYIVGGLMMVMSFTPLPFFQFFLAGTVLIGAGIYKQRSERDASNKDSVEELEESGVRAPIQVEHSVPDIKLVLGYKLEPLFNGGGAGDTIHNLAYKMRREFAELYGVEIPLIDVVDDISMEPSSKYIIKIKEGDAASGIIKENKVLAMETSLTIEKIDGDETVDPVTGGPALWIDPDKIDHATMVGYDVYDPLTVIAAHLHEVILSHLHVMVDFQKVADMIEDVGLKKPIIKEMLKKMDNLNQLHKVISSLLKERISIKDLPTILEGYLDAKQTTEDLDTIIEVIRQRISRQIRQLNINSKDGYLYAIMLDQGLEGTLPIKNYAGSNTLELSSSGQESLIGAVQAQLQAAREIHLNPAIVVQRPELRPALNRLLQNYNIFVNVLSVYEISPSEPNKIIGYIKVDEV